MAYVLVYLVGDLKYYVQKYRGEIRLNGLINNAFSYREEWQAKEDIPKCKINLGISERGALHIKEVLP